jgi:hypothetical protein
MAVTVPTGRQFPPNPSPGELWFDEGGEVLYIFTRKRTWVAVG